MYLTRKINNLKIVSLKLQAMDGTNPTNISQFEDDVTNETWGDFDPSNAPDSQKALKIAILLAIAFMCVVGNLLIIAVFIRKRELKTPINYLIVNMAVSDLLVPVFVLTSDISDVLHDFQYLVDGTVGAIFCVISLVFDAMSSAVSIVSMVAIAVDRFHAVLFAMRRALISSRTCLYLIAATWIIALGFAAPLGFGARLKQVECTFVWDPESDTDKVWITLWLVRCICLRVVPLILLTFLYGSIAAFLSRQKPNPHMAPEIQRQRIEENKKVVCMLVTVVVIFAVSWIPYDIAVLVDYFFPALELPPALEFAVDHMPYLYTVLNPLVYYVFSEKYRQGFREVLCWPFNHCKSHSAAVSVEESVQHAARGSGFTEQFELTERSIPTV